MTRYTEIAAKCLRDEAQALLDLIPGLDENFDRAVEIILRCKGKVIVTGVGKSGNVGAKIAATFSSTGTPSFFINPLDAYHGDLGVITSADVMIAISNSGQTDEILRFVPYLKDNNIPLIGITGNPDSLLARNSTCYLDIHVKEEACPLNLAPTSSTTATIAMGDALACVLIEARDFRARDFARFHPGGSLGRMLLTTAEDVMRVDELPVIGPEMPLGQAIIHVSKGKLGLCVIIENDRILGIVTDGDVRRATERLGERFFNVLVSDVMTPNPVCVPKTMKVGDIMNLLHKRKIHAVLVTDDDDKLVGIVDNFACGE